MARSCPSAIRKRYTSRGLRKDRIVKNTSLTDKACEYRISGNRRFTSVDNHCSNLILFVLISSSNSLLFDSTNTPLSIQSINFFA